MNATTDVQTNEHKLHMDRMYRFQRHFYDATRAYYLLGRDQILRELAPPENSFVFEVGCGTGRNLVQAAKLYPTCQFIGVDISDEMLLTAANKMSVANLTDKVSLFQADATNLENHPALSKRRYDRIYFSYTLSMIPKWQTAIVSAASLLSDTGQLHIVDFGPCSGLPKPFKGALYRWLSAFDVTPRDALAKAVSITGYDAQQSLSHRGYAAHLKLTRKQP